MTATLKIKTGPDGKVDPDTMAILLDLSAHCHSCDECEKAQILKDGRLYCATGRGIAERLMEQSDVEIVPNWS